MYNDLTQIFINSFVKGIARTSSALLTLFVGWQFVNVSNDHFMPFFLRSQKKKIVDPVVHLSEHEEINLEDVQDVNKFKKLFNKW